MRPARRADPPHRPDHSKKPRSPLQSPSPDRLPDPSAGAQSFTHSDTDISLPPIASYPTPQLGSKMTKARTAEFIREVVDLDPAFVALEADIGLPHLIEQLNAVGEAVPGIKAFQHIPDFALVEFAGGFDFDGPGAFGVGAPLGDVV